MCLFTHKWKLRSSQPMYRGPVGMAQEDMAPVTLVLYVCEGCGNSKTERRDGHWAPSAFSRDDGKEAQ